MIFDLFIIFFKIGLFSFGGGYGMLPLMLEESVSHGWLTEGEFSAFLAVSESTPGPIAINMATFVGSTQAGFLGSVCATLGVILPSIIIILLIVAVFKNFLKYQIVKSALTGMKPIISGLIFATGLYLGLKNVFPAITEFSLSGFSIASLIITAVMTAIFLLYKKFAKKNLSPIILIVFGAVCGMLFL